MLVQTKQDPSTKQRLHHQPSPTLRPAQPHLQINPSTPYIPDFKITGNRITYLPAFTSYYSQLLVDYDIPKDCVFCLKVRIVQSKECGIFIGVSRLAEYGGMRNSHQLEGCFSYFGKKRLVWPGADEQGSGFRQGDIVEMRLDRKKQEIVWLVNGDKQARKINSMLVDTDFVPCFEMYQQGDVIEWLGSWVQ